MIIPVDLDRSGVRLCAVLFVVVIEIRFAEPAAVHHHLVPSIDLQAVLGEVEEITTGPCTAQQRRSYPAAADLSLSWLSHENQPFLGSLLQPSHGKRKKKEGRKKRTDRDAHDIVDLNPRGEPGSIDEELWKVDVDVAAALRKPARPTHANTRQLVVSCLLVCAASKQSGHSGGSAGDGCCGQQFYRWTYLQPPEWPTMNRKFGSSPGSQEGSATSEPRPNCMFAVISGIRSGLEMRYSPPSATRTNTHIHAHHTVSCVRRRGDGVREVVP